MKKFIKISLGLGFWISFMLICGAAESSKWEWTFIFLGILGCIIYIGNKMFDTPNKDLNF